MRKMEAIKDIVVEIMAEVLKIFAIMTKEIKQGQASESIPNDMFRLVDSDSERLFKDFFKTLIGRTDIKDALSRLDRLTQEEVKMVIAQVWKATDRIEGGLGTVNEKVKGVSDDLKQHIKGTVGAVSTHNAISDSCTTRWKGKGSP
jgi:hypothetical protein